jgi:hypothetical protein
VVDGFGTALGCGVVPPAGLGFFAGFFLAGVTAGLGFAGGIGMVIGICIVE